MRDIECPACHATGYIKNARGHKVKCYRCEGFARIKNTTKCESCGVALSDHLGLTGTCAQLQEANKRIAELEADKVKLTGVLAEKQEQLDALAHKALDLEAENKRLGDDNVWSDLDDFTECCATFLVQLEGIDKAIPVYWNANALLVSLTSRFSLETSRVIRARHMPEPPKEQNS